ncbi:peptidase U32 [Clostridia bacterium]|nr:peptidase U32 [Clostridia bacterium]
MLELLAPAGDLEKLHAGLQYGADAVYFGGGTFSLRAAAAHFSPMDTAEAVRLCRKQGVKAYLTLNIYPHDEDVEPLTTFLRSLKAAADIMKDHAGKACLPDAFIVSDPGVLAILKDVLPQVGTTDGATAGPEIHLSTQANVTSAPAAKFWYGQGVRRLILARELSLIEIAKIRDQIPDDMALEAFVHGAICMAYSGRCLLSNYLNGRDSNRGQCSQPCRWEYTLEEAKRPGEHFPIEEDERGTYLLSANDLCMIEHIPELVKAGISSFKIEGRMKSAYYVASIVRAYRWAIDAAQKGEPYDPLWFAELEKASHRRFSTGFFYGVPGKNQLEEITEAPEHGEGMEYIRDYEFLGNVLGYDAETGLARVEVRGKFSLGEAIEIFGPTPGFSEITVGELYDESMRPLDAAASAMQIVYLKIASPMQPNDMIRRARRRRWRPGT